jgi:hypothetical protein
MSSIFSWTVLPELVPAFNFQPPVLTRRLLCSPRQVRGGLLPAQRLQHLWRVRKRRGVGVLRAGPAAAHRHPAGVSVPGGRRVRRASGPGGGRVRSTSGPGGKRVRRPCGPGAVRPGTGVRGLRRQLPRRELRGEYGPWRCGAAGGWRRVGDVRCADAGRFETDKTDNQRR